MTELALIDPLPQAPTRNDPVNFSERGDALMTALPPMVEQINVLIPAISAAADAAESAPLAAAEAAASAELASASAASAVSAPGTSATSTTAVLVGPGMKTLTVQADKEIVAGMSVMIASTATPTAVWMFGVVDSYVRATGALMVGVTALKGSGTLSAWTVSLSGTAGPNIEPPLLKSSRAENIPLTVTDLHTLIEITAGTFTQTSIGMEILGAGWHCWYRNRGSGAVTYAPGGLVNGYPILIINSGECYFLQGDGVNATAILVEDGSTAFKYATAGDTVVANVMQEYLPAGPVVPWNGAITTAAGQVALAAANVATTPAVTCGCTLADGRIVVVGRVSGTSEPGFNLFTPTGVFISTTSIDAAACSSAEGMMSVAATDNGGFVVVWRRSSDSYPMYRGYDSAAAPLYAATVAATSTHYASAILAIPSFFIVLRHTVANNVTWTKYNYAGVQQSTGTLFAASVDTLECLLLISGNFVVAYTDTADSQKIKFAVFNQAMQQQGATVVVLASSGQYPKLAKHVAGKFAVFYRATYNTSSNSSLRGTIYNDNATVSTAEVNFTGTTTAYIAAVAWNGSNFGVMVTSYFDLQYVTLHLLSPTLATVNTISSLVGAGVNPDGKVIVATSRGDFLSLLSGAPAKTITHAGFSTNLAGVARSPAAPGGLVKLQTKGVAPLATAVATNVNFDHSAKAPVGVKGAVYNYSAVLV